MIGRTVAMGIVILTVGSLFGGCASTQSRTDGNPEGVEKGAAVQVQMKNGDRLQGVMVEEDTAFFTIRVNTAPDTLLRLNKDAVFFIETLEPPARRKSSRLVSAGLFIVFLVAFSYALSMSLIGRFPS